MTKGLSKLESLTDTALDSAIGYEKAAEKAESASLTQTLQEQAGKRRQLVNDLNAEIVRLGGEARESRTFTGTVHHIWTDLSGLFENGDEAAAERVEEGEDYIAKKFEEALEHGEFDPQTRTVIERACAEVKEGERLTDRLEALHD
ncbi:MAG: PA2169 family four-helix-bundle protein [Sphingomonadaceae bacterium]|nr:PA2169 family four-helix-bundle protein [Sphingomonadaceae bacterium]